MHFSIEELVHFSMYPFHMKSRIDPNKGTLLNLVDQRNKLTIRCEFDLDMINQPCKWGWLNMYCKLTMKVEVK
jgi:hypothetical protein